MIYDHVGKNSRQLDHSTNKSRDRMMWNAAADYAINYDLVKHKIGTMPKVGLYDARFAGMPSEEIYEVLKSENNSPQETLDVHLSMDGDSDDDNDEGNDSAPGGEKDGKWQGKKPQYSEEEKRRISDEIKQAVIQAAQASGAGDIPGGIKRLIKDITEPQMDWRDLLRCQLQSIFKSDFTFSRPSRKSFSSGIILPGMKNDDTAKACVAIDTSGSVSEDMLRDFLSEVKGIMESYQDYELHVWCFDTSIHNPVTFTPSNMDELDDYEIQGFGGTRFTINFDYMKDNDIVPEQFIMFTDGHPCGGWGDESFCDTLFVIHGDKNIEAPFGQTVHYEKG
jgi:predicted metal-dependent peptidase